LPFLSDKLIKKALIYMKAFSVRDLAGVRTQDPLLKREMLYQLSYQISSEIGGANIIAFYILPS
jgi:hypothetical protein